MIPQHQAAYLDVAPFRYRSDTVEDHSIAETPDSVASPCQSIHF